MKFLVWFVFLTVSLTAAADDLDALLEDCFAYYDLLRHPENGVYRDAIRFDRNDFHPASVATNGIGLMALVLGDSLGYVADAEAKALQTLRSLAGEEPGFHPDRNATGYFRHFIDYDTGEQAWNSEYSSIDTGILVRGVQYCAGYFEHAEIQRLAAKITEHIDWSAGIADPVSGGIYRELNEAGKGIETAITLPFNEYMIVGWLARNQERDAGISGKATALWNRHYANPQNLPTSSYNDIPVLTDRPGGFLSSFTIQFAYYLCNRFDDNTAYLPFFENAMRADRQWCETFGGEPYEWGSGAGSYPESGYHADAVQNNPQQVVSPHIVAGFAPVDDNAAADLQQLLHDDAYRYSFDGSDAVVLWRHSLKKTDWRATDIQGIDYACMLFGLVLLRSEINEWPITTVEKREIPNAPPTGFGVLETFPNPFNQSTTILLNLAHPQAVQLQIFDARGRKVAAESRQAAVRHSFVWNGRASGAALPTGVYFVSAETPGFQHTHKILLLR